MPDSCLDSCDHGDPLHPITVTRRIAGGGNSVCLTDAAHWRFPGGEYGPANGVPGSTNHAMHFIRCDDIQVIPDANHKPTILHANGSDALNFFGCTNTLVDGVVIDGKLFNGQDNPQHDIGRDIVIDGNGHGGAKNIIRNCRLRNLTIAAGSGHIVQGVVIVGPLQIGGGYEKDVTREPFITVRLVGVRASKLFVHPLISVVQIDDSCVFGAIEAKGNIKRGKFAA